MILKINDTDYSQYLKRPYYLEKTLDESLNQGHLILKNTSVSEPFAPFSKIEVDDELWYLGSDACEEVVGKDLYNHDILLVEETKITERIICPAKTFTNALIKEAPDHQVSARMYYGEASPATLPANGIPPILYALDEDFSKAELSVTPQIGKSKTINAPSAELPNFDGTAFTDFTWEVFILDNLTGEVEDSTTIANYDTSFSYYFDNYSDYHIVYVATFGATVYAYYVNISVVPDTQTKDDYTIGTVVKELLQSAECLRTSDVQWLQMDAAEFTKWDEVPAPDFSFANGRSLWENLLEIGGYIHAIPRVTNNYVFFDVLGGTEDATITGRLISKSVSYSAEQYCNKIDTLASNLMSDDGDITEPLSSSGGYKSLRTDDKIRINEDNGIIVLDYNAQEIIKVEVGVIGGETIGDITQYVFEKSEYDLLSAYSGVYPYSQTYAIYYEQDSNTIQGLFYKADDALISSIFNRYAIVNIINEVVDDDDFCSDNIDNYADKLIFRVTYKPLVDMRIRQIKNDVISTPDGHDLVLAYNQSADKLSSKQLGKNLKGTIAMLGTSDEKTRTYLYKPTADLPQVGKLVDGNNYINKVTAEYNGTYTKATITLTTNYNRYGAYVGINRDIRQFEISAKNVYDRQAIYENHIVLSDSATTITADSGIITDDALHKISGTYTGAMQKAAIAKIITLDESDNELQTVLMPIMSVVAGNSAEFTVTFKDNFSAGSMSVKSANADALYRELKYTPYADIFGVAKKMTVNIYQIVGFNIATYGSEETARLVAHSLPKYTSYVVPSNLIFSTGSYPIILNKDSRERIIFNYQLHFYSDTGIIISENFVKMYGFTQNYTFTDASPTIKYMSNKIQAISGTADSYATIEEYAVTTGSDMITIGDRTSSDEFVSWGIFRDGNFMFGKNSNVKPNFIKFTRGRINS